MSDEELLDSIKEKIQRILNKKFSGDSYIKRKIDVFHDRLNFACPYCCDSRLSQRKKRGNLYFSGLHFHCFNCGEHVGVKKFLSDFGENLSLDETVAVREIQQNSKHFEKRNAD